MTKPRDYDSELDSVKARLDQLQWLVEQIAGAAPGNPEETGSPETKSTGRPDGGETDAGAVYYAGHHDAGAVRRRWEPQERSIGELLKLDGDKAAKVLSALGSKQRLDILKAVLTEPQSGAELVERLNMGTTGQLYHHTKALLGAGLLAQEERGGLYSLPARRTLPVLLLLAAAAKLLDASDFMALSDVRGSAGDYFGDGQEACDPHQLLWAVLENSVLEHQAGYCTEVSIILQPDGSATVADNGRGIPIQALPGGGTPVQTVLTELGKQSASASFVATGAEKGINMAVVNALADRLSVEVRREGKICRQDYRRGIPQTALLTVGFTKETGTSVTLEPDRELFGIGFDPAALEARIAELAGRHPGLDVRLVRSPA